VSKLARTPDGGVLMLNVVADPRTANGLSPASRSGKATWLSPRRTWWRGVRHGTLSWIVPENAMRCLAAKQRGSEMLTA